MWWFVLLACSSGPPTAPALVSEPTTPTKDLTEGEDQKPVFPEATSAWFPQGQVSLPPKLGGLSPGMPIEDALRVLYPLLDKPPYMRTVEGTTAHSGLVKDLPRVSVTLLEQTGGLLEVQVGLNSDLALPLLINRWGDPDLADRTKLPHAEFHWTQQVSDEMNWTVTLHKVDKEQTLVRYHVEDLEPSAKPRRPSSP